MRTKLLMVRPSCLDSFTISVRSSGMKRTVTGKSRSTPAGARRFGVDVIIVVSSLWSYAIHK